jgi:hypothetical protein
MSGRKGRGRKGNKREGRIGTPSAGLAKEVNKHNNRLV